MLSIIVELAIALHTKCLEIFSQEMLLPFQPRYFDNVNLGNHAIENDQGGAFSL